MKKFLLLCSMMLTMVATSMAAIDTSKEYRIKDSGTGYYLNAGNYTAHTDGPIGGVNVVAYAEDDDQIFTFTQSGSNYTLRTKSGYNIVCQQWNVDALTSAATALTFVDNGNGTYYIMKGTTYFKVEQVSGVYYPFCDAPSSAKATWTLEPLQAVDAPERTISVTASPTIGGTVTVDGVASVTKSGPVTITATPAEGYKFVKWTLDGADITTQPSFTNNIEGDKNYVAIFVETAIVDVYNEQVCKPTFAKSGNTSFITAAAIGNANGVTPGSYALGSLAAQGQQGVTDPVAVIPGATFNLNITYTINWGDITFYQFQGSESEKLYGSFDGTWPSGNPISAMTSAGMTVSGNTVTVPITVPSDLVPGEVFVIRSLVGEEPTSACQTGFTEGAYLDFLFYVDSYTVSVSSSDATMGTAYIGTEGTTSVSCAADGTDTVTLTAVPTTGYQFVNWTLDGVVVSTDAVYTTTAVTESREYVANFEFKPVEPRTVKVASNDKTKGYAVFVSPMPEGTATDVTTGEIVTVRAITQTTNDVFVNWTINGEVVSTEETYNYAGAEAVTIQANFATLYPVNIASSTGGEIKVKQGATSIDSGNRVAEGSIITITVEGKNNQWVKTLMINGENVLPSSQEKKYTTQVTVNGETNIVATFGAPAMILTYEYTGGGYIEVWTSDSYNEGDEETFPAIPAGDQYAMWDEIEGESVCIFIYPQAGEELLSLTINGEDYDFATDLEEYGDIFYEPTEPLNIVAEFSGNWNSVESTEVAENTIYAVAGGVQVEAAEATNVEVYSIAGTLVAEKVISGTSTIALAKGVYIVKAAEKVTKVIVK